VSLIIEITHIIIIIIVYYRPKLQTRLITKIQIKLMSKFLGGKIILEQEETLKIKRNLWLYLN